uniref:C3H1-type domain-containing protein n=1 Tax=Coccolithus braarudii TaxID=221442 RepID=A0A7S0LPN3_9EUKA|mmetsp:Transcript_47873/g.102281  ORF Transcript_47873/g.102281 Transcript_47873/m.102281 type:complete len:101 (+) Transcript_47873:115-417(+)
MSRVNKLQDKARVRSGKTRVHEHEGTSRAQARPLTAAQKLLQGRGSVLRPIRRTTKGRTTPCKFWLLGSCVRGEACAFLHGMPPETAAEPPTSAPAGASS